MSQTTKDPIALARVALKTGRAALPDYATSKSGHTYTQPQLFALLVLKQFFKLDYRGTVAWVARWRELRQALGLKRVPHYATLCYAERRLLKKGALTVSWPPPSSKHAIKA